MVTGALYQWVKLDVGESDHSPPTYIKVIPLISYLNPLSPFVMFTNVYFQEN
jgi:hypothetical protein